MASTPSPVGRAESVGSARRKSGAGGTKLLSVVQSLREDISVDSAKDHAKPSNALKAVQAAGRAASLMRKGTKQGVAERSHSRSSASRVTRKAWAELAPAGQEPRDGEEKVFGVRNLLNNVSEKMGLASTGGSQAGKDAKRRNGGRIVFRGRGESAERCGRCSREAVLIAVDVFLSFDPDRKGFISREQYRDSLKEPPTVERLRVLRRSNLEDRFRRSAQPVYLEEFLYMVWPGLKEKDLQTMLRWAQLREAFSVLKGSQFKAHDLQLRQIYDLLDAPKRDNQVRLGEIVRAQIASRDEVFKILKQAHKTDFHAPITYDDFKQLFLTYLKNTYVSTENMRLMKQDEDSQQTTQFESMFHAQVHRER
jgi:Ca2+-binding EF-hand superfamily protein